MRSFRVFRLSFLSGNSPPHYTFSAPKAQEPPRRTVYAGGTGPYPGEPGGPIKSDRLTAGRDDASGTAFPIRELEKPPDDRRWMAAFLFMFLSAAEGAPQLERPEHEREDHCDHGKNLKVGHDLTSFALVCIRGEKPSAIYFLPLGSQRLRL